MRMLAGAVLLAATAAQAQNHAGAEQARVLSSTPLVEQGQVTGYTVEYEFGGRRYTTRMAQAPDATLPVQVTPLGVSTYPVEARAPVTVSPLGNSGAPAAPAGAPWTDVQPQPGVVLSSQGQAYGMAPPARPAYVVQSAPVYAAPYPYAPVYAYPYAASYPQPAAWAYPPVNLSFNLGYSRGWRGGYGGIGYHGRGWR
ncbi:MAG: hypothetical protein EOO29_25105 [Comamonadaceae bacterium]|nr:MAG: hypothetical protein EOO29_25105 [Comamonadaceae bacterium]